jgi:hypothetical protein
VGEPNIHLSGLTSDRTHLQVKLCLGGAHLPPTQSAAARGVDFSNTFKVLFVRHGPACERLLPLAPSQTDV